MKNGQMPQIQYRKTIELAIGKPSTGGRPKEKKAPFLFPQTGERKNGSPLLIPPKGERLRNRVIKQIAFPKDRDKLCLAMTGTRVLGAAISESLIIERGYKPCHP
jgi:hypothetical protein